MSESSPKSKKTDLSLQAPLPPIYQEMLLIVAQSEQGHHTRKAYLSALDGFFRWLVPRNQKIDRKAAGEYRESLKAQGYSPNSINLKLAAIRRLAREMYLSGKIDIQQRDGIEHIKQVPLSRRVAGGSTSLKARWLTLEELKTLLNLRFSKRTAVQLRYEALIAILTLTGLRIAEVASLTLANVDVRNNAVVLKDIKTKGGLLDTKALPQLAYERIVALWPESKGSAEQSLLSWKEVTIRWCLEEASKRSGIKFTPHDLRRSFAALAADAGASVDEIASALGHASTRTTMIYMGDRRKFTGGPGDKLEKLLLKEQTNG